jgi:hypothetical protein
MEKQEYPKYFDPMYGSFIITVNDKEEYSEMSKQMLAPREISEFEACIKMVHHMVDFQDDGFRNWCDGLNITNPCNPVVILSFDMLDIEAMYEAFIQSWGLDPITLTETVWGAQ